MTADSPSPPPLRMTPSRMLCSCIMFLLLMAVPGCDGCPKLDPTAWRKKKEEELKKEKKADIKPKEDFTFGPIQVQPSEQAEFIRNYVKAGHWMSAVRTMKANNFDFHGQIDSATVNSSSQQFDIQGTLYRISMARPAPLPKGQLKYFETLQYIPLSQNRQQNEKAWFQTKLRAARGGREAATSMLPMTDLSTHESFLVVLSNEPAAYGYLQKLDSVTPPTGELFTEDSTVWHYRVVLAKVDQPIPLPSHPLAWTTIAYLVWDGILPDSLNHDQQQAMLDWLHWGGQLIISGPHTLDLLRGSFLEPYLPAQGGGARELAQQDFSELNEHWSLLSERSQQKQTLSVVPDRPIVGIQLEQHPEADVIPQTNSLAVERRVGGGRIVVTAFPLAERQIVNWGSFDSFFNAGLLRRPPRRFSTTDVLGVRTDWARRADHYHWEKLSPAKFRLAFKTNELTSHEDPRLLSKLRYFTRDSSELKTAQDERRPWEDFRSDWLAGGYASSGESGMAGWNDVSGASNAARAALREAAGISIPKSSFVLQVLALYLIVLVPVNWGVFRMLGRVEWAWVAAPLIALVGAVVVVRTAQLDIGFARSRTQLNVLEVQGNYPRSHLTRYTALYTSLSTAYDLEFADRTALALPFPADPSRTRGLHDPIKHVTFRREKASTLEDFQVDSNSTGLIHSEQMLDLGGPLLLSGGSGESWQVDNRSGLTIKGTGVLYRDEQGVLQGAWLGDLSAKTKMPLQFKRMADQRPWFKQWDESSTTARTDEPADTLSLWRLLELAALQLSLEPGETRLLGWTEEDLPGLKITPAASQTSVRTLVLVHLRRGELPEPLPDVNLKSDVQNEEDEDADDSFPLFN